MSINKKYYYLKFKENYFEQDHIKVIESMTNGYEYSLIILKLYLKSVKFEGQLKINESIPYLASKIDLLAGVLGHDPANVMHAINIAKDLGVIEIIDSGEIFLKDIQNFIGHSSTEGDRKRDYRKRISGELTTINKTGNNGGQKVDKCPDIRTPEIEIEKEKELDIEIKKEIKKKRFTPPTLQEVEEYVLLKNLNVEPIKFIEYFQLSNWVDSKGNKVKNWKQKLLTWSNYNKKEPTKKVENKKQDLIPEEEYNKLLNMEIG